jgi:23S rRNA (adenine2503-C2)-methyltransferase
MKFLHIINNPHGLEIGARHISVSTSGIVPRILDYAKEDIQSNLAISLHAPNNEIRSKIMPVNKAYPLEKLIPAIKEYIRITDRRVTFEYIMLKGLNDTKECANALCDLVHGMNCYINLIPYNEVKEKPYKRSEKGDMHQFFDILKKRHINVQLRKEQGSDIDAACGQLRSNQMKKEGN